MFTIQSMDGCRARGSIGRFPVCSAALPLCQAFASKEPKRTMEMCNEKVPRQNTPAHKYNGKQQMHASWLEPVYVPIHLLYCTLYASIQFIYECFSCHAAIQPVCACAEKHTIFVLRIARKQSAPAAQRAATLYIALDFIVVQSGASAFFCALPCAPY